MDLSEKYIDQLNLLCLRYNVEKMYLFGSVLTSAFDKKSDVDILVRFKSGEIPDYFMNYLNLKERLTELFERKIDLVEEQALKNPILINSINKSKKLVYG